MKLSDILTRERVVVDLQSDDKNTLLRELVRKGLLEEGQTPGLETDDEERILSVLEDRERLGSTGIKDGLAIPHGKVAGLQHLTACLGISRAGVNFGALDGARSHIFLLLMSPEQCGGDHLKALARVSRLFSGGHLQKRLLDAPSREAMFEEITSEDARL